MRRNGCFFRREAHLLVVGLVLAQDPPQMGLVPDEGGGRGARAGMLRSRVRRSRSCGASARCRGTVRIPASARTASDAAVKFEPRSRIMNVTRCACSPRSMIGLRACWAVQAPVGCGVTSEDADAPGGVLGHGQGVGMGAVGQAGHEEAARQDRLGLAAQELGPGWPGPARCGPDSRVLQVSHTVGAGTRAPSPASSPWILR